MTDEQDKSKWIGGDDQHEYYENDGVQPAVATGVEDSGEKSGPAEEQTLMERGEHDHYDDFDEAPYDPAKEAIREIDADGIVEAAFQKTYDGGSPEELEYQGLINRLAKVLEIRGKELTTEQYFMLTGGKADILRLEQILMLKGKEYYQETMQKIDSELARSGINRQDIVDRVRETVEVHRKKLEAENKLERERLEREKPVAPPAEPEKKKKGILGRFFK